MIKLERMNESDDKVYAEFLKRCQANLTYKKAETIASKYGYRLAPLCYVEVAKSGKKLISFNVAAIDQNSYHPKIYFSSKFGKNPEFEIQTTAYGAMSLSEHSKFIKAVTDANKMVSELSKIDLTTLESTEMEDFYESVDRIKIGKINESMNFRVEKYNNIIIKVITDPEDRWISSNIKKALDKLQDQNKIDGYLSSLGRYEVYHDGNLSPNKLVDILVDYVGDGDRVADKYRPNDIIKVML